MTCNFVLDSDLDISERSVICPASPAEVAFCQDEPSLQPSENRLLGVARQRLLQTPRR